MFKNIFYLAFKNLEQDECGFYIVLVFMDYYKPLNLHLFFYSKVTMSNKSQ